MARIEQNEHATKQLGTRICVSAPLAAKAKDFRGRPMGDLVLRGKSEALPALEPLRASQYEDPSTQSYMEAFAKLECNDPGAIDWGVHYLSSGSPPIHG
jgi:adenylate cyclase